MAGELAGTAPLPTAADACAQDVASSSTAPLSADHLCLVPEGECESENGCETPGEDAGDAGEASRSSGDALYNTMTQHSESLLSDPFDANSEAGTLSEAAELKAAADGQAAGADTSDIGSKQSTLKLPASQTPKDRPSVTFHAQPGASKQTGARSSGTTIFTRGSQVARPSLPGLFKPNPSGKAGPLTDMQKEAESDFLKPSTSSCSLAITEEEEESQQRTRSSDGSLGELGKLQGTAAVDSKNNSPRFSMDSAKPSFGIGNQSAGRRPQAPQSVPEMISKNLMAAREQLANQHEAVIRMVNERLNDMHKEAWTLQAENRGLKSQVGKLSQQLEAFRVSGAEPANTEENSSTPGRVSASETIAESHSHEPDKSTEPRRLLHPLSGSVRQPERDSFQVGGAEDLETIEGKKLQWNLLSSVPSFVGAQQCQIVPVDSTLSNRDTMTGINSNQTDANLHRPGAKCVRMPIDGSEEVRSLRMEKFEVLREWREKTGEDERARPTVHCKLRQKRQRKVHSLNFADSMLDTEEDEPKAKSCTERVIINPNSPKRVWWDMGSLILVVYDMISIPLQLFEPPESALTILLAWLARFFWTADIWMTFFTGILKEDGTVEMRVKLIARRYLLTWFAIDVSIVISDWSELLWMDTTRVGYERIGKASRTFRIVRMIRLLRLIRMRQVVRLITERIRSERLTIVADMVKIILVICGLAHLIACIWYGIGNSDNANSESWVDQFGLATKNLGYRYTTSLHWSLSQFAGGMDEVKPYNLGERVFAIFVFLFAFTTATVFVSSLTSSMTRLHIIGGQRQQKLAILRRYLTENNISSRLAIRVARNAQHVLGEQERSIPEANVELIMCVSEALRVELHFEMYSPVYATHLFFMRYTEECPQVMCRVCHCATSMVSLSTMDVVFNAGEIPANPKMYFMLANGMMQYVSITGHVSQLPEPTWISEACLWTAWMHLGTLTATRETRLCVLDSHSFMEIVNQFDHPDFDPRTYAAQFVRELNAGEPSDLPSSEALVDWAVQRDGARSNSRSNGGSIHQSSGFRSFLPRKFRPSVDVGTCYSQPLGGKATVDKNAIPPSGRDYSIG